MQFTNLELTDICIVSLEAPRKIFLGFTSQSTIFDSCWDDNMSSWDELVLISHCFAGPNQGRNCFQRLSADN